MSFRFSKQQRENLLKAIDDYVAFLNNPHRIDSDYTPEPFLFRVERTHRNAFIALVEQDIDLLLATLDSERKRKKGRGAPQKKAVRQFVRHVAGHVEDVLGIKPMVTHAPRGKGGLLAKVVQISLQAGGEKAPADPFRLLASAIGRTRGARDEAEKPVSVWREGASFFPCDDHLHRHRTPEAAELCRKRGISKKRKFQVEINIPARKRRRRVKRSPRKPI
jgi:hypothetical protein